MDRTQFDGWVELGFGIDGSCDDLGALNAALHALASISGAVEAQRLVCASALAACSTDPLVDLAAGSRAGRRDAAGAIERVEVIERAPSLGEALSSGEVVGAHVDRLGGALRRLDPQQQSRLLDGLPGLVDVARRCDSDEFDRHLRRVERALRADDGQALFERQQRNVRLKTWTDREDGMHHWHLTVDPRTAIGLDNRLRAATDALFRGRAGVLPPFAPSDPRERQAFLRAHALIGMLNGDGLRLGRPEYVIVEDRRVPPGSPPVVDFGLPIDLPAAHTAELARRAVVRRVVVDGPRIIEAPGRMRLGRSRRLASQDQRRALRALYATCAIPGCQVRFDDCTAHHVVWWRAPHDGPTDLDNLVPVCAQHHHDLHDRGWTATLDADRRLVVRRPGRHDAIGLPNRIERTSQSASPASPIPPAKPTAGRGMRSRDARAGPTQRGGP